VALVTCLNSALHLQILYQAVESLQRLDQEQWEIQELANLVCSRNSHRAPLQCRNSDLLLTLAQAAESRLKQNQGHMGLPNSDQMLDCLQ
jgi:hypothetical protein